MIDVLKNRGTCLRQPSCVSQHEEDSYGAVVNLLWEGKGVKRRAYKDRDASCQESFIQGPRTLCLSCHDKAEDGALYVAHNLITVLVRVRRADILCTPHQDV